jgi:hypothetical protein
MIHDPFPRAPTSASRVNVRDGRGDFVRATTYINLPDPKAPRVRRVKKGRKFIRRITYK